MPDILKLWKIKRLTKNNHPSNKRKKKKKNLPGDDVFFIFGRNPDVDLLWRLLKAIRNEDSWQNKCHSAWNCHVFFRRDSRHVCFFGVFVGNDACRRCNPSPLKKGKLIRTYTHPRRRFMEAAVFSTNGGKLRDANAERWRVYENISTRPLTQAEPSHAAS